MHVNDSSYRNVDWADIVWTKHDLDLVQNNDAYARHSAQKSNEDWKFIYLWQQVVKLESKQEQSHAFITE